MGWGKKAIGMFLIAIIIGLIGNNLYSNWEKLQDFTFNLNYLPLIFSLMFLMSAWIASVWIIQQVFRSMGFKIPFKKVYSIYFRSVFGKYLPGKFWQIAGSTYLASRRGIPEGTAIMAFVLGQIYSVLSGLILVAVVMFAQLSKESPLFNKGMQWEYVPILILTILFALRPKLLQFPINKILRWLKRETIKIDAGVGYGFKLTLYYIACWLIFGFSFWLFVKALIPIELGQYFTLSAVHSAGIVIGFLAIFAPGGIGVREGVIIFMLTQLTNFQVPYPTIIAIGFRLITSISELLSFTITWIIDR